MEWDAIVLGSGPAGATAAMYLARANKRVLLIDKANFPRDKVCGDAQGRKAGSIIKELGLHDEYIRLEGQEIYGLTISSPNSTVVDFDVEIRENPAPGYVHKRFVFDNFLFQNARKRVTEFRILNVNDVIIENDVVKGVRGTNSKGQIEEHRCKILLAADGAVSVVARKFNLDKNPPEHFIVALRAYYKNVKGMSDRIEIHMIKSLLPGYFWIFPLPNGEANVGLGMITKDMNEKKVNLRTALFQQISENPLFTDRFAEAELVSEVRGWNLPIASYHRKCYGDGFMLLGDAASLIDPLSGEGVGYAMTSGRIAAAIAVEALGKNDFSERFFKKYDTILWDTLGPEIKANYRLQRLGKRFPFLLDKLMEKSQKDADFRHKVEKKLLPHAVGREELGSKEFLKILSPVEIDDD